MKINKLGLFGWMGYFLLFSQPSQALPEKKQKEMENWIHKHAFLQPDIFSPIGGYCAYYAKRKLINNHILHFIFTCRSGSSYHPPLGDIEPIDILEVYKYNKENKVAPQDDDREIFRPQFVYDATYYLDIWQRNNAGALELLKNVYDAGVAEDFKQSKLVYKGDEYGCIEHGDSGFRRIKLDSETFKHNCAGPMRIMGNVQLLMGQKYLYEVRNEADLFNFQVPQEDESGPFNPPVKQLIIRQKKQLPEILSIIAYNNNRYENIKNRSSPANIHFEEKNGQ
jgi:hypothetical protein